MVVVSECLPCFRPFTERIKSSSRVPSSFRKKRSFTTDDSEPTRVGDVREKAPSRNIVARVLSPAPKQDFDEKRHRASMSKDALRDLDEDGSFSAGTLGSGGDEYRETRSDRLGSTVRRPSTDRGTQEVQMTEGMDEKERLEDRVVVAEQEEKQKVDENEEMDWEHHWRWRLKRQKELQRELQLELQQMDSVAAATSDAESEFLHLPMQDTDGHDIRPINSRLDRPPSWEYGVPMLSVDTQTSTNATTNANTESKPQDNDVPVSTDKPLPPVSPESPEQPFSGMVAGEDRDEDNGDGDGDGDRDKYGDGMASLVSPLTEGSVNGSENKRRSGSGIGVGTGRPGARSPTGTTWPKRPSGMVNIDGIATRLSFSAAAAAAAAAAADEPPPAAAARSKTMSWRESRGPPPGPGWI